MPQPTQRIFGTWAMTNDLQPWVVGLLLGVVSALSFPLGATLGLIRPLGENSLSILLSFGGGALIFALSIELFGDEYEATKESPYRSEALVCMTVLGVLGAVSFVMLNNCIGEHAEEEEVDGVVSVHRSSRVRIHVPDSSAQLLDQARTRPDKLGGMPSVFFILFIQILLFSNFGSIMNTKTFLS